VSHDHCPPGRAAAAGTLDEERALPGRAPRRRSPRTRAAACRQRRPQGARRGRDRACSGSPDRRAEAVAPCRSRQAPARTGTPEGVSDVRTVPRRGVGDGRQSAGGLRPLVEGERGRKSPAAAARADGGRPPAAKSSRSAPTRTGLPVGEHADRRISSGDGPVRCRGVTPLGYAQRASAGGRARETPEAHRGGGPASRRSRRRRTARQPRTSSAGGVGGRARRKRSKRRA
jgi:hypothetical protein